MQSSEFNTLAKKILSDLGITKPDQHQISNIESLISNTTIQSTLLIDIKLTKQEKLCLLLAAFGKTAQGTAKLLGISTETVKEYRKEVKRKLRCRTIAHAIFQGLRFGFINNQTILPPLSRG